MKTYQLVLAGCLGIYPGLAATSADVPLFWKTLEISTDDHGGATVSASIDDDGELERLQVTIRGHDISIPESCLSGLTRPLLNGLSITYGQSQSGQSSWSIEIPYDGTGTVELGATFNLVFTESELKWSYTSIQLDERTWEDEDVCALNSLTDE